MKRWFQLFALLLVFAPVHAAAQAFWVSGLDESGPLQLRLYTGSTPATVSVASTSTRVSVLVHLSSLSASEWDLVQTRIRNLVTATRQSGGLDVYVVSDTGLRSWQQSKNAAQLQGELKKLTPPSAALSAESAWSEIAESLPEAKDTFESLIVFASPGEIENASLRNYAAAYLPFRARNKRVRVFHWPIAEAAVSSSWKELSDYTCGAELPSNFDTKNLAFLSGSGCSVVAYASPALSSGVFPYVGQLIDKTGRELRSVQLLNLGKDSQPVRIDRYQEMLRAFSSAEAALAANDGAGVAASLQETLQINPMHVPALRLGSDLYKRQQDWDTALKLLSPLTEVMSADAALWAEIGDLNFNLKRWEAGETAYRRSVGLREAQPKVIERLSQIREALDDLPGAESFLGRVLALTPNRVDLQIRRGDFLVKLNRSSDAARAFEEALKLDQELDDVRLRLMGIYKDLGAPAEIARHLEIRAKDVPPDADLRLKYADLAVSAKLPDQAIRFFTGTLNVDGKLEPAYFGKADALVKLNRNADAIVVADEGLKASPSVRLHLLKFDILDGEGRLAESRVAIEDALPLGGRDVEVLRRYSRIMDIYGKDAGTAYLQLAEALSKTNSGVDARKLVLRRGLTVSLRDGESAAGRSIREALTSLGETVDVKPPASVAEGTTIIPGGVRGLAGAFNIRGDVPSESFVLEFSQALLRNAQENSKQAAQKRIESLKLYFDALEKLKKIMTPGQSGIDSVLDSGRQGYDRSQVILKLLGWRMDRERNRVVVQVGTDNDEAERQLFSSGFGIDFLALKQALENGKTFSLHIPYESVRIAFDEAFWFEKAMDTNNRPPGGLCEALIDHLPAARLYVAMASITAETRQQLLKNVSAERLAKKYSDYLAFYGSSLSVAGGEVEVPGGKAAFSAWEKLVGASPARAGVFLNALLEKNDGKLLAYFHTLYHLPAANQRFFTRTPQRLNAFYKAFPFSEKDILERHLLIRRDTHFFNLLRELPLDKDGNILFPGSDQVWIVAKGTGGSETEIGKLLKRARKAVPPDVEDEILLNLLDRNYEVDNVAHNQSENFLAVVRIDQHRSEPMDEATALVLAQNYGVYRALYPYFSLLPRMSSDDLIQFFRAARTIEQVNSDHIDSVLGEFHGIISLIALLHQAGGIPESDAHALLLSYCDGVRSAKEPVDFAKVTLAELQTVAKSLPGATTDSVDARLLAALAGPASETTFRSGQEYWTINRSEWQQKRISGVLTSQTATPLQVLVNLYEGIAALQGASPDPQLVIKALGENTTKLLEVTPKGEDRLTDQDRQRLIAGRPKEIVRIVADLVKEAAKRNSKSLPKLANDLAEELIPYTKVSLTAWTYAWYSAPDDLVIAEDPYFVRRHVFYSKIDNKNYWRETEVRNTNDQSGLYLHGGLAEIAIAAGQWGQGKADASESVSADPASEYAARAQLAAIRSVPWRRVSTDAIHLAGLQIRLGREIVVAAATDASLRRVMSERLMGWVGNFRRHIIGQALEENDPQTALEMMSSSDLYFLVIMMKDELNNWKATNPLLQEFRSRQQSAAWTQVSFFGGFHLRTYGCIEPHLIALGPYEEFELMLQKDSMSERLSHLLLNLAEMADRDSVPADAVAMLAELALRQVVQNMKMVDNDDWLSAIHAMNRIELAKLLPELEKASR